MNEKNMFYGGYPPINQIPNNNYKFNDISERLNRLERQIKRLEQRITRIETPYINKDYNNNDDNNMYIM